MVEQSNLATLIFTLLAFSEKMLSFLTHATIRRTTGIHAKNHPVMIIIYFNIRFSEAIILHTVYYNNITSHIARLESLQP